MKIKKILQNIFSIRNTDRHKLITILGVKIKYRSHCSIYDYRNYVVKSSMHTFGIFKEKKKFFYPFEQKDYQFFCDYFVNRFIETKKPSIMYLEYKLLTKCSLNCKECCHYAPYFKKQMSPISFEEFKANLDKLLEAVDSIWYLNLMGGEALLHKDLPKILEYVLSKKQVLNCVFTTNCLTLPSKDLIDVIKDNKKVFVFMSDYSPNEKLLPILKIEELKKIFEDNNVVYSITKFDSWNKAPRLSLHGEKYEKGSCWMRSCHTFANGYIYFCPLEFYAHFNNRPLKIKKDEIVDVLNSTPKQLAKNLLKFYFKDEYEFCHYCKTDMSKKIPVAEQVARNVTDIDM